MTKTNMTLIAVIAILMGLLYSQSVHTQADWEGCWQVPPSQTVVGYTYRDDGIRGEARQQLAVVDENNVLRFVRVDDLADIDCAADE